MSAKHTPGPWGWQKMGEWVLVGQHGMRPIVLSTRTTGPMKERGFTSLNAARGLLVPFDPDHPDSKLIAAAPTLADALEALLAEDMDGRAGDYLMSDAENRACAALRAAGRLGGEGAPPARQAAKGEVDEQ